MFDIEEWPKALLIFMFIPTRCWPCGEKKCIIIIIKYYSVLRSGIKYCSVLSDKNYCSVSRSDILFSIESLVNIDQ